MSDTVLHDDTMTLADDEAFVATQPEETRWELIAGRLVQMTKPTGNHGQITLNLAMPFLVYGPSKGSALSKSSHSLPTAEDCA